DRFAALGGPEPITGRVDQSPSSKSPKSPRSARTRSGTATHQRAQSSGKTPTRRSRPRPSKSAGSSRHALRCTGSSGMLPANYATIVRFMVADGYSRFESAGSTGHSYQEYKGNPEDVGAAGSWWCGTIHQP